MRKKAEAKEKKMSPQTEAKIREYAEKHGIEAAKSEFWTFPVEEIVKAGKGEAEEAEPETSQIELTFSSSSDFDGESWAYRRKAKGSEKALEYHRGEDASPEYKERLIAKARKNAQQLGCRLLVMQGFSRVLADERY